MIYFIRGGDYIKIGFTAASSAEPRLSQLQTSSPFPLKILATIQGTQDDERRLHKQWSDHHAHGEWFHFGLKLQWFIAEINRKENERFAQWCGIWRRIGDDVRRRQRLARKKERNRFDMWKRAFAWMWHEIGLWHSGEMDRSVSALCFDGACDHQALSVVPTRRLAIAIKGNV